MSLKLSGEESKETAAWAHLQWRLGVAERARTLGQRPSSSGASEAKAYPAQDSQRAVPEPGRSEHAQQQRLPHPAGEYG